MRIKIVSLLFTFLLFTTQTAFAQRSEVTISLNEQFFDALLDAVFENAGPIEFPLASVTHKRPESHQSRVAFPSAAHSAFSAPGSAALGETCPGVVRVLREMNGTRTAVRFRDGKIYAPLAFAGSYSPPFVGCVQFSGWAESIIALEFDDSGQRLVARAQIQNVSLDGMAGIGGTLIARMIQSSIDKKINPIEVVRLDKLSFIVPIKNAASMRVRATRIRHDVVPGAVNVRVGVEFLKN